MYKNVLLQNTMWYLPSLIPIQALPTKQSRGSWACRALGHLLWSVSHIQSCLATVKGKKSLNQHEAQMSQSTVIQEQGFAPSLQCTLYWMHQAKTVLLRSLCTEVKICTTEAMVIQCDSQCYTMCVCDILFTVKCSWCFVLCVAKILYYSCISACQKLQMLQMHMRDLYEKGFLVHIHTMMWSHADAICSGHVMLYIITIVEHAFKILNTQYYVDFMCYGIYLWWIIASHPGSSPFLFSMERSLGTRLGGSVINIIAKFTALPLNTWLMLTW